MKRALVTGIRGFVGEYLRQELSENGYEVIGLTSRADDVNLTADIRNPEQLEAAVEEASPDVIIHLAGQANVFKSWRIPQDTFALNVIGTINLLEAVRELKLRPRIVLVGSSDQYGHLGEAGRHVTEETPCRPATPYAVSKKAQEEIARVYVRTYGMDICMTRSFNHGGAGQKEGFLIPDFTSGMVRVEKGLAPCMKVGNLDSRRDFTHVKDVARAYRLIAEQGRAGEVYNVGSGTAYSAREILDMLLASATCKVPVEQDPARMRPSDTPVICCDHSKLSRDTGWEPKLGIERILSDTLTEWRTKLS